MLPFSAALDLTPRLRCPARGAAGSPPARVVLFATPESRGGSSTCRQVGAAGQCPAAVLHASALTGWRSRSRPRARGRWRDRSRRRTPVGSSVPPSAASEREAEQLAPWIADTTSLSPLLEAYDRCTACRRRTSPAPPRKEGQGKLSAQHKSGPALIAGASVDQRWPRPNAATKILDLAASE